MPKDATSRTDAVARTASGAGLLVSCLPMVAMLPGVAGSVLGVVGLGASSALVSRLAPGLGVVAQPLLLFSVLMLAVGGLQCGRTVVALALVGGALLYLSMYIWTGRGGGTSPVPFYVGLGCFVGAYVVSWSRRRGRRCRPLVSPVLAGRLMIVTVVAGAAMIAFVVITSDGPGAGMPMSVHG